MLNGIDQALKLPFVQLQSRFVSTTIMGPAVASHVFGRTEKERQ
jgi:hypothetical protein